ncbi:Hpt domain-containing protein [Dehalobacter sp. DCM]|uniref:Hpt domain-containing protein n=1 Tax=Dehalobacter sp. DCM TaxID=2907827 RepID=UPI00308149DA|nr:Hpt domain-containing protein [Dehalobacter sp. DCM]
MTDTVNYFINIMDLCNGDIDVVLEISSDMVNLFAEEINHINQSMRQGDYDTLTKSAHKLRSAVVNFEMDAAAILLNRLEQMAKEGKIITEDDIHQAKRIIELLQKEIDAFQRAFLRLRSSADESL